MILTAEPPRCATRPAESIYREPWQGAFSTFTANHTCADERVVGRLSETNAAGRARVCTRPAPPGRFREHRRQRRRAPYKQTKKKQNTNNHPAARLAGIDAPPQTPLNRPAACVQQLLHK